MRTVEVRIAPDGTITAATQGYTGTDCMNAIPMLEALCDALVVQSSFLEQSDEPCINHTHNTLGDIKCRT